MRKINTVLFTALCLLLTINTAKANEYYCSQDTSFYSSDYIYDTSKTAEAKCSWQKMSFLQKITLTDTQIA